MRKHHYTTLLLAALMCLASCDKGDDTDSGNSPDDGTPSNTVILYNVEYTMTVKCGGQLSKVSSTVDEEVSELPLTFTDEDVAKPLVMTVSGKDVSGTLTLMDTDGTFAGTLQVPVGVADTLDLVGTIEIPAAGTAGDGNSIVSLDDLIKKCGHRYTARFKYHSADPVKLTDSKAYIHFIMSPCQHWLRVNNEKYTMSEDGRLWIAMDEQSALVTNFYRIPYDRVNGGCLYTIDRDGMVDLGIFNTLWADKNVGAESIGDVGEYFYWDEAQECVSAPLELPMASLADDRTNDYYSLCDTYNFKGYYGDRWGYYFLAVGAFDINNDPYVFFPAAGLRIGGVINSLDEYGVYWSCGDFDSMEGYRLYFHKYNLSWYSHHDKNFGGMSVRAIRRGNADSYNGGGNGGDKDKGELEPFFPYDYYPENVVAWYTCKDEDNMEEWALYLYNDYSYLLTQYVAANDARVIYKAGDFVLNGAEDPSYNNFEVTTTGVEGTTTVTFADGRCKFLGKDFVHETGELPEESDFSRNNLSNHKDPVMYFPYNNYSVENVVAWYKQSDAPKTNFVSLFLFSDNRFVVVNNIIKDGQVTGSEMGSGSFEIISEGELDYRNFTVNVEINTMSGKQEITFKDGRVEIITVKAEYQELDLMKEMLGL